MTPAPRIAASRVARLYDQSQAARWGLPADVFRATLEASVGHAPWRNQRMGSGSRGKWQPSRFGDALWLRASQGPSVRLRDRSTRANIRSFKALGAGEDSETWSGERCGFRSTDARLLRVNTCRPMSIDTVTG
jgi:hypothetical protein